MRYGGLHLAGQLSGGEELEVPLYWVRDDAVPDHGAPDHAGNRLVVAPLATSSGSRRLTHDAGRDRIAALYDRALRLAHVEHPALPRLVESMAPELPEPFLAWGVAGAHDQNLRDVIDRATIELATATRIVLQIAAALEALHAAGEVHGGICPANVLVDMEHTVSLVGVGLASTRVPAAALPPMVARYRAPEQLSLGRGAIDPRSDVFAVGTILYELVHGQPAFPGATLPELEAAMASGPPTSKGHRLAALGDSIREPLDRVLRRALQLDPADRFRTAGELARCLRELLDQLEPERRPTGGVVQEARLVVPPAHGSTRTGGKLADRRRELSREAEPLPRSLWLVPAVVLLVLVAMLLAMWLR
ncbi:MAG TPA: protein kinase [Thermoanaerobaculia bacterium]|nr:protein kinase [Thermoanaerobaculia bacterium]